MSLTNALQLIEELSVEEVRQLHRDQLLFIVSGLTKAEISEFMFAKNIKIFGGINGYVNDFLSTGTVAKIKSMPEGVSKITIRDGALQTLHKMLKYESLTDMSRAKINAAISELEYGTAAAAAGGSRRRRTRTCKNKTKTKHKPRNKK